jgi:hypothetical protein
MEAELSKEAHQIVQIQDEQNHANRLKLTRQAGNIGQKAGSCPICCEIAGGEIGFCGGSLALGAHLLGALKHKKQRPPKRPLRFARQMTGLRVGWLKAA